MNKDTTNGTIEKNAAERNMPFEYENAFEEWSIAGIGNTFLFGKVMTSNPNLLLELLQYSLPEFHIKQIENPEKEADVKLSIDAHGNYKYTFRNTCQEEKELVLDDGVTKVVLNAAGHKGDITSELKEFLQLVAGNVDPANYAEGSFADRVQRQVHIARRNARWRKEYMDWEMTLRNEREKGREEGREEGRMEERAKTEEQRKRAEAEKERAEAEKERAEAEKERADAAEERIRILEEQLAQWRKGVQ